MSRGFSDVEKQAIHALLIEKGKMLFSKFGFKKTSILDITKAVGIAQGTFYKFFKSKEELYFVILELEEKGIREQLLNVDISKDNSPKKTIKDLLHHMIHIVETNPLIRQLYFGSHMNDMLEKLPPKLVRNHFKNDLTSFQTLVEKWKAEGVTIEEDPEVIAGIIRALFVLTLHQKEVGETVYQKTMERLIALIVDGLFKEG